MASATTMELTDGGSPEAPDGVTPISNLVRVNLSGVKLQKPATISFPRPTGTGEDPLVVMWEDGQGGWMALPTRSSSTRVSAQTVHFSGGFLARIDVQAWASSRLEDLKNYITGRSDVDQPTCGDEGAARAGGVKLLSDGGDSVKWCYGVEDGHTVVKVANNRRTFTSVTYPKAWKVKNGASISISADTLARALGTWAAEAVSRGKAARVVDGGDTLTLVLPDGASGRVTAESDFTAWSVSAIAFGLEIASGVRSAFGVEAGDSFGRFMSVVTGGGPDFESYTAALKTCTKAIGELVKSNADAAEAASDVLKLMWKCVPSLAAADLKATGWTMFGAGIFLQMLVGAVAAILTAVNLLVTGIREIWDEVASFGGKSDAIYDIVIRQPLPPLTVGLPWGPYQSGYGETRPSVVFNGGDPTGLVTGITWDSWGGDVATGSGYSDFVPDGYAVAEGHQAKVRIYAWDPGPCADQQAYRLVDWYFPDEPGSWAKPDLGDSYDALNTDRYYDLCVPEWRDYLDTFTKSQEFAP